MQFVETRQAENFIKGKDLKTGDRVELTRGEAIVVSLAEGDRETKYLLIEGENSLQPIFDECNYVVTTAIKSVRLRDLDYSTAFYIKDDPKKSIYLYVHNIEHPNHRTIISWNIYNRPVHFPTAGLVDGLGTEVVPVKLHKLEYSLPADEAK